LSRPEFVGASTKPRLIHVSIEFTAESVEQVLAVGHLQGVASIDTAEIGMERLPSTWLLCDATATQATGMADENVQAKPSDNGRSPDFAAPEKANNQGRCPGHLVSEGGLEPPRP
jgi:hypothetical protein